MEVHEIGADRGERRGDRRVHDRLEVLRVDRSVIHEAHALEHAFAPRRCSGDDRTP
jgi:hypothetical protein